MPEQIAFLDEWGNTELDFTKPATSTHYIVAALLLSKTSLPAIEERLEVIRHQFFPNAHIDASKVGNDDKRRLQILTELLKLPFHIFGLVVDKRQLRTEGFQYKGSFYKFLHGLADRELYRTFPNLELVANRLGSDSFMDGFVKYVYANHIPNLFNQSSFGFVQDSSELMMQAAGFVADALARCYDETVLSEHRQEFSSLLKSKMLTFRYWPEAFQPLSVQVPEEAFLYNREIAELSLQLAQDYLHRNLNYANAPQKIDQVHCLGYLVFHFRHVNPMRYISSRELMNHIQAGRNTNISLHYFQAKVIAPLRDAGVLIASSSKGYKLPAGEQDLYNFINHSNTIIQPLLSRIQKCRDRILLATNGELDLLSQSEYKLLKKLLD